jgi:hypothetical protein
MFVFESLRICQILKMKNPILERELRDPIIGNQYLDQDSPDKPSTIKNPPFWQFYKGASFDYLKGKMNENSKAMAVWFELVSLMDNQGSVIISQTALSEFFGVTRQTINSWIKWLDDNDLISIFKIGTANVYAINGTIVSDRLITQKQSFTLFNARVVAEKKEQTKKIKQKFFSVADVKTEQNKIEIDPNQLDMFE